MKTLYFFLSTLSSLFLGFTFVSNLEYSFEFNYVVFMFMVAVLFFIFVIFSILSIERRPKSKSLFYNSYSERRVRNEEFDKDYSFLNK